MPRITYELALGMSLALEASESDMERIRSLLHDRADATESLQLALELLLRARRRIETVREALGDAAEPIFS
jgi:hypothetical protein